MNAHRPIPGKLGLTPVQSRFLDFIKAEIAQGRSPSYREIGEHFGLRSKSGVHRVVTSLIDRGHLLPVSRRARALALVPDPAVAAKAAAESRRLAYEDLARRETAPGSGMAAYSVALSFDLALRLLDACHDCACAPGDVIAAAVEEHLGRRP